MSPLAYWRLVVRKSLQETSLFALNKMLVSGAVSLGTILIQWHFGLRLWDATIQIILSIVFSYVLVLLTAFIINLLRVPAAMHSDQAKIISTNNVRISTLMAKSEELERQLDEPSVDRQEQDRRNLVAEKIKEYTIEEKKILRVLLDHGQMSLNALCRILQVPERFVEETVEKAQRAVLIDSERSFASGITHYWIKPELGSALDFVLRTGRPDVPTNSARES